MARSGAAGSLRWPPARRGARDRRSQSGPRFRICATTRRRRPLPPPPPKPFRIVFPEGFTRAQMAQRVEVVARIADASAVGRCGSRAQATSARPARSPSRASAAPAHQDRGVPLPGDVRLPRGDDRWAARSRPGAGVLSQLADARPGYARSKNLTPYDVLKIASMVEKEAVAPAERPLIAAVIYNRLRERMPLGIDATLRYGLHISPDAVDPRVAAPEPEPVQLAQPARTAADADRQPGARLAPRGSPSGDRSTISTSCASRTRCTTSSPRARRSSTQYECAHGYGC